MDIIYVKPSDLIDLFNNNLKDNAFYRFLIDKSSKLSDNDYYKFYKSELERGIHPQRINGIKNDKDIFKRLKYLLNLKELIKEDSEFKEIDKVQVIIDCFGHIRIFDGCHRSICSLVLGIDKIPVEVVWRHPDWVKFKDELLSEYPKRRLYNPINHPDFDDWEVARDYERSYSILDYIDKQEWLIPNEIHEDNGLRSSYRFTPMSYFKDDKVYNLKGLDLGCHIGYFCL